MRIAIASAKQCRRAVVPRIDPAVYFRDWLVADHSSLQILLTEPSVADAEKPRQSPFPNLKDKPGQSRLSATLGVGPEGGWSAVEVTAAKDAGFQTLTLGRRTLRADAVAIIAIGVLQYEWGDL
jgi:16S rRNA (uracil1498-N3)-methyltransferase